MKIGLPVWYRDKSIQRRIETAAKMGFDYVEVSLDYPWPETISARNLMSIKRKSKELGIEIAFHAPWRGITLCHPRELIRQAALKVIEECISTGSDLYPAYFNIHLGSSFDSQSNKVMNKVRQQAQLSVNHLAHCCQEEGIQLTVENDETGFFSRPRPLQFLVESRDVHLCLDVGHVFKSSLAKGRTRGSILKFLSPWFETYGHRILVMHIHDCQVSGNSLNDHLPLGLGIVNFERVFKLGRKSACEYMLVEIHSSKSEQQASDEDFYKGLCYCRVLLSR